MAYRDFRLDTVCKTFGLVLQRGPLFAAAERGTVDDDHDHDDD
jgi:hypothetical protein